MKENGYFLFAGALGASFFMSLVLTDVVRRLALRWDFLDHPGERKVHVHPIPLLGGVAICVTFYTVILIALFGLPLLQPFGGEWFKMHFLSGLGGNVSAKLTGLLAGGFIIFLLGVLDDRKALSPEAKLVGQILAAGVLVYSGMRIQLFILSDVFWLSVAVTLLWVITLTNALNFLDNMDGLSGGVSVIAAFSFFLAVQPFEQDQYLTRLVLVVFAGSVCGFLCHNLNPAKIFMGDAGALFCGYLLSAVAIMGTFHVASTPSPVSVIAPILALSVPLFDITSVVYIRWRKGESIMKGDKRHFSHRLVDLGMTPQQAVEFIFLVGAVTGLGGALLSQVNMTGAVIILGQTVGMYLLIVLLMRAGRKSGGTGV